MQAISLSNSQGVALTQASCKTAGKDWQKVAPLPSVDLPIPAYILTKAITEGYSLGLFISFFERGLAWGIREKAIPLLIYLSMASSKNCFLPLK